MPTRRSSNIASKLVRSWSQTGSKLVRSRFEAGRREVHDHLRTCLRPASNLLRTSLEPDSVMEFGFKFLCSSPCNTRWLCLSVIAEKTVVDTLHSSQRELLYFPLKIDSFLLGLDPDLIHDSSGQSEPTTQTASRSVQPFFSRAH